MYKILFTTFLVVFSNCLLASSMRPLPLSKLSEISDLIVLAHVVSVTPASSVDTVQIEITEYIKGKSKSKTIEVTLHVRGGLREFDPELKVNDIGVFYLRESSKDKYMAAYAGSIALLQSSLIKPSL